jgi:hypothetical protein
LHAIAWQNQTADASIVDESNVNNIVNEWIQVSLDLRDWYYVIGEKALYGVGNT